MLCPCGRASVYEGCCGPLIDGSAHPETAEALMRSRYTAYARGEVDYLVATHEPRPDRARIADWARRATFKSLQIVDLVAGGPDDTTGVVEFIARYEEDGRPGELHERARFRRIDGRWIYVEARKRR